MPNSPRRASTCELVLALMPNRPISDRHRLEQVRHRECTVEQRQRAVADFGRQRDVVIARALQRRA